MNIRHLSVLAYAQGFTLWAYHDPATRIADMTARDFFADAIDMLASRDVIYLVGCDGVKQVSVTRHHDRIETEAVT